MEAIKEAWDFFQSEILGMGWLDRLVGAMLNAFGLDTASRIGGSVRFFVYDMVKIMVLLCVLIMLISYIQSYFPPERTKKILGRFHGIGANTAAALLGTVTPFCSCSSIPLFIGFTSAGLPLGVTFSFLISSPRKPCSAYEHFRMEGSCCLCGFRPDDSCSWRNAYRKAAS